MLRFLMLDKYSSSIALKRGGDGSSYRPGDAPRRLLPSGERCGGWREFERPDRGRWLSPPEKVKSTASAIEIASSSRSIRPSRERGPCSPGGGKDESCSDIRSQGKASPERPDWLERRRSMLPVMSCFMVKNWSSNQEIKWKCGDW